MAIGKILLMLLPKIIITPDAAQNEASLFAKVFDDTSTLSELPDTAELLLEPPRKINASPRPKTFEGA